MSIPRLCRPPGWCWRQTTSRYRRPRRADGVRGHDGRWVDERRRAIPPGSRDPLPGRGAVSAKPEDRLTGGPDVVERHDRQTVHPAADASRVAHLDQAEDGGAGRGRPVGDLGREAARPGDV